MAIKKIFKSTIENMNYIFQNGKSAVFNGNRFITDVKYEVTELMAEVQDIGAGKSSHPYIYVDENESEIDTTLQDKIKAAQAEAVLKVMAENSVVVGDDGVMKSAAGAVSSPVKSAVISPANLAGLIVGNQGGANTGIASTASAGNTAALSNS